MRFAGWEDEGVTRFNRSCSIFVSGRAFAGNDVIEFPLRGVQMIRIRSFARRNANDFDIEWMPLVEIGGLRLSAQCFGDFSACAREFAFWRRPWLPREVVGV